KGLTGAKPATSARSSCEGSDSAWNSKDIAHTPRTAFSSRFESTENLQAQLGYWYGKYSPDTGKAPLTAPRVSDRKSVVMVRRTYRFAAYAASRYRASPVS